MIIVGHRGIAGCYPENTEASVKAAIELGLTWIEVDVQPTQDNYLVICHDHTIDRCSNGSGRVDKHTLASLEDLDFGGWFDPQFQNEPILTLEKLLSLIKLHDVNLNLEIKVDRHPPRQVCEMLKQQLAASNVDPNSIVLSSFSHQILRELHELLPNFKLGVLCNRLDRKSKALLKEVNAFSCNINYRWVSQSQINKLKVEGYEVWSYTVNNPSRLKHLANLDAIFTDYPERFL